MLINKVNNSQYIQGDSLEYMKEAERLGLKFDAIITDPPYGINHKSNRRKDKKDTTTSSGILNDKDNDDLLKEAIDLAYNIMEDDAHIYWFTRWDRVDIQLPMLKEKFNMKNIIIWDKGNHGSGDLLGAYGNRYEVVLYGMKGRRTFNKIDGRVRHPDILSIDNFTDPDILRYKDSEIPYIAHDVLAEIYGIDPEILSYLKVAHQKLIHPHQKPLDLLTVLFKKSTDEKELVLDMFGGVGSTIVSGENINRSVVALELNNIVYQDGLGYIEEEVDDFTSFTEVSSLEESIKSLIKYKKEK